MNGEQNTATETQASFLDRLREATTDEQVILYRVSGRELEFIERYGAASIAASTEADIMADVKAEHGGGSYELRLIDARGTIRGRDKFSIAGLPKKPREERDTNSSSGGNELAAVLAAIQQSNQQTQQLLLVGLDKIAQAVAPQPGGGMKEALELLATAREIVTPPASVNPASPVSQLKEFLQIKSLLGELDGGKSGGDWGDLLGMAAPLLQMAQQQATPAPATPTAPRPRRLPKPTGTRTLPAGMTEAEEAQYRANVAQLVTLAANGTEPASMAQVIVAQSPDREQLAQLVAADPVPWLAQFDPRVNEHAAWFRALSQQIAGLIDEPVPALDGATTAHPGQDSARGRRKRHAADAQDHGATGAPGPGASRRPRARRAAGAAPAAEGVPG